LISEVSLTHDNIIFKLNSGKNRVISYSKLESIKSSDYKLFGIEIKDPSDNSYVVRFRHSIWKVEKFGINKKIALMLEEKNKLGSSTPSPAPSR
jgi:hypothetical protein